MSEPELSLEGLLETHPLDEVGRDINEILQLGHDVIELVNRRTYFTTIEVGDVSIFFASQERPTNPRFVVGLDLIRDGEYIPMADFCWDIHNPAGTEDTPEDISQLREVVRLTGSIGV